MLKGSVPIQQLREFRRSLNAASVNAARVNFVPAAQFDDCFRLLQSWRDPSAQPSLLRNPLNRNAEPLDLVSLGDSWLTAAIQQQLITPLDPKPWSQWPNLAAPWRSLLQRNAKGQSDPQGSLWAAPYRWGSTIMVYRRDRFRNLGWEPTDWSDLWRPELQGYISLPDDLREVLGLTLKSLGQSYNTPDPGAIASLSTQLAQLQRQVKFYSSRFYLQPLLLKDTWLAVGWSSDILPILKRDRNLAVVYPASGTALWANLWVRPVRASSDHLSTANAWIDFCLNSTMATAMAIQGNGTAPLGLANPQTLTQRLSRDRRFTSLPHADILFPPALDQSEFILPLSESSERTYSRLWEQMRRGELS